MCVVHCKVMIIVTNNCVLCRIVFLGSVKVKWERQTVIIGFEDYHKKLLWT